MDVEIAMHILLRSTGTTCAKDGCSLFYRRCECETAIDKKIIKEHFRQEYKDTIAHHTFGSIQKQLPAGKHLEVSMTTPKEAYRRLNEHTRQEIESKAVSLYAHLPYEDVTARLICETLKINSATLYRWFNSKDELYIYLMNTLLKRAAPPDGLLWDMDDFISDANQENWYTADEKLFVTSWTRVPERVMTELIFDNASITAAVVRNNLIRMQQEGTVRQDIDIDLTAYIYNTLIYNIQRYISQQGIEDLSEVTRIQHYVYYELLRTGIKGQYAENERKKSTSD